MNIAYYRVSTDKQGESGLGLAAQQAAVEKFLGTKPDDQEVEVESGKRAENRPALLRAIERCRATGARLVVAKLDRLARNCGFICSLLDSKVDFIAVDNPNANRLTVQILAAVAEDEARRISDRTKAALSATKARGQKLGGSANHSPEQRAVRCAKMREARRLKQVRAGAETARGSIAQAYPGL
jgi:DNA invertase Pin-like site-specific DNA recombinase